MNYEDIPLIENVRYLRGHDLVIKFANGEDRICDMSMFFASESSRRFYNLPVFKEVKFRPSFIYWGDEEYTIGVDSIYNMSIPIPQFISSQIKLLGV